MSLITGIQAYYKLENVNDSTPAAKTLTNQGTVSFATDGKILKGATYTKTTDKRLYIDDNLGFTSTSANSWSLWWKPTTGADGGYIFDAATNSGALRHITLYIGASNHISLYTWANDLDTGYAMNDGTWYHIVVTNNGSGTAEIFVDTVSKGTVALGTGSTLNFGKLSIGCQEGSGTTSVSGTIDEFGVWNKVLSTAEIAYLYALGTPGISQQYPFVRNPTKNYLKNRWRARIDLGGVSSGY